MRNLFAGVIPALVTPFTENEAFVPGPFEKLIEKVYRAGAHGIYVCGQTGEGLAQDVSSRERVAEVAVRCSPPDKTVIVHVGAYRTADAMRLAGHAAEIDAHAISSLPPIGSYSFLEIKQYYQRIASVSNLPCLVYFFPQLAPAITSAEQILELCAIPHVVGLKFTDFDLFKMSRIQRAGNVVFNGRDEVFAAGLLMGADGGIGTFYNIVPELFVSVYDLTRAGQWKEARELQDRINDLIAITLRFPVFPAIKTMLAWSGINCGPCLAPRRMLTRAEQAELRNMLAQSGFEAIVQTNAAV